MTRPTRLLAALVIVGSALVVGAGGPPGVLAQEADAPPPRLVSQNPWVAEGEPVTLAFAVNGGLPEDGTVELTLYGALTSRDALVGGTREPALLGGVRDTLSIPTALVPERRDGAFRLQLATDGSPSGLPVADPGVYPLALAVAGADGQPGPALLTWIVRTAENAEENRLRTAVILPLHAPPSFAADGFPEMSERARNLLDTRIRLLNRHPGLALTVAPTPELVEAVAATDPDRLGDLADALDEHHVVGGSYVRVDLTAHAAVDDLTRPLAEQFTAGNRALRRALARPVDNRTWVGTGHPSSSALDALEAVGIDRAVFRGEQVNEVDAPIDETVVVSGDDGQAIAALLSDPILRSHVNGTSDPALSAQRALADLALLATPVGDGGVAEDDGEAGVVLELPASRPLPAAFLYALLRGLQADGPLRPVTLAGLFTADLSGDGEGIEPGPFVTGTALVGQDLTAYGRNLAATRRAVDGYTNFAGPDDPLVADLRRRLLVSGASELTEAERGDHLRAVSLTISARTAEVAITDDETVTLTSREGDIPLTVQNDTGGPVEVTLAFDSENKLDFPDGATRRLRLVEGPNRVAVPVVARASGAFPLRVTATSPDGVLVVSRAQVTVRSTAVSGVGLVLSVGALLVLVVWWARHWRSARRDRRLIELDTLEPG